MSLISPAAPNLQTQALPEILSGGLPRFWYAVHARPNQEKLVAQMAVIRDVEAFLPSYNTKSRWKNRLQPIIERPLLPGYLFVRISSEERLKVLSVPGVVRIVGTREQMVPIPDAEVEWLRSACKMGIVEPHALLNVGDKTRIVSGPFAGMQGIVVQRRSGIRMVVNIDFAMRAVALEIDGSDLERIRPR